MYYKNLKKIFTRTQRMKTLIVEFKKKTYLTKKIIFLIFFMFGLQILAKLFWLENTNKAHVNSEHIKLIDLFRKMEDAFREKIVRPKYDVNCSRILELDKVINTFFWI